MVSTRIKQLRKGLGLTQAEFGKKLGVSRDVISNIEYQRVEPKEMFLDHLCYVFQINPVWLINGEGNPADVDIQVRNNVNKALEIFESLNPELQDYALKQLELINELNLNKNAP